MRGKQSRRAFLVGAGGVCVALPLLEITQGRAHAATPAAQAKRFIVFFSHGGSISCRDRKGAKQDGKGTHHGQDLWAPADPGQSLVLGEEASPLAALTNELILLRGVDNMAGTLGPNGGSHGHANATALTCADAGGKVAQGPSIDQVLAGRLSTDAPTAFPSIDLQVGNVGYGTPLFSAAQQVVSSETLPQAAFDRLFKNVNPTSGGPDPALVALRAQKKSVLDGVLDGFKLFRTQLGSADRVMLDAHAEHIRSMETQLATLGEVTASCTLPGMSPAPSNYKDAEKVAPLMVDLIVHAMRCGLTNVATLQIGDLITNWLPTPWGDNIAHGLGHAARDVGPTGSKKARVNDFFGEILPNRQWRMTMFARLLDGLKNTPEGAGNMLDNSVVLFTSEFSTASVHSVRDVPVLLAGKAGGRWQTGRHINYNKHAASNPNTLQYSTDASTHNVYTSILQAFGYPDAHFGNDAAYKKGPLAELG